MDKIRNLLFHKKENDSEENPVHEFCPNCEANLLRQKGYDPSLPYWVCLGCGQMLINPALDTEVAWICDGCGEMLNIQAGFDEDCGEWTCTECGYVNRIDETELYLSEEEYQASKLDPYKGLPDDDALKLSMYEEVDTVHGREDIVIIREKESGKDISKNFY